MQCLALAAEAGSWGTRNFPDDPRWSETFGAVVTSWLAFSDPSPSVNGGSLLAWIATYLTATSGQSVAGTGAARGKRINEVTGHVAFTGAGRLLGRQLIEQAKELDAARAEAVAQADRLATEVERHRQHVLMWGKLTRYQNLERMGSRHLIRILNAIEFQHVEHIAGGSGRRDELKGTYQVRVFG